MSKQLTLTQTEEMVQEIVTQAFMGCKKFATISESEAPRAEVVITYMGYEILSKEDDKIKFRWPKE